MTALVEAFGLFARWATILEIGAPLGAVVACLGAYYFARRRRATFEFADALLFSAAGGLLAPTLASVAGVALGALGPDVATFGQVASLLLYTAFIGLFIGLTIGVPLGLLAAWVAVRRGAAPLRQSGRRQN